MYNEFLEKTEYVDYDDPAIKSLAERLKAESSDEISLIRNTYYFVRDEIKHERLGFAPSKEGMVLVKFAKANDFVQIGIDAEDYYRIKDSEKDTDE